MSATTITLNKDYFTTEVTKSFLEDLENACKTMEVETFINLFDKYDLSFIEDYDEVLASIKLIMTRWDRREQGTKLLEVTSFDSKCLFCYLGKSVKAYQWSYQHLGAIAPFNRAIYSSKIAFVFYFDGDKLIEFGTCNGFLNREDMEELNS